MLPMIGVPTTAGTGSEAQSYAIISDPRTHRKMACGDPKAAFRAVILDPRLTLTQPASVTATAGYDAIAHAVESFVCTKRNPRSQEMSLEAWRLLEANYERVLAAPDDLEGRAAMQLGAFYAGTAIEISMLGATHACANPVTARYGTTHGNAIAILLPHVVRWNASVAEPMYAELFGTSTDSLAERLSALAAKGDLPRTLREAGASTGDLPALAAEAAEQWTGRFNPAPVRRRRGSGDLRMRVLICVATCAVVSVVSGVSRTVIAQQTSWPQFRGNPQLTGIASSTLPPTLKVLWTFDAKEADRVVCRYRRRGGLCGIGRGRAGLA